MELLECKNLSKSFDNKKILKDINLIIPRGKIVGLLGKNGQGKTTLIKLINDLLTPTSGEILIEGKHPGVESKRIISYLPERTYLDKEMKVIDTLNYFNEFYDNFDRFPKIIDKEIKNIIIYMLQQDLDTKEEKKIL